MYAKEESLCSLFFLCELCDSPLPLHLTARGFHPIKPTEPRGSFSRSSGKLQALGYSTRLLSRWASGAGAHTAHRTPLNATWIVDVTAHFPTRRKHHEHVHHQRWNRALLQGLGLRTARGLQPRLAPERRRLRRPDELPRQPGLPLCRPRPPRSWALQPALQRQ